MQTDGSSAAPAPAALRFGFHAHRGQLEIQIESIDVGAAGPQCERASAAQLTFERSIDGSALQIDRQVARTELDSAWLPTCLHLLEVHDRTMAGDDVDAAHQTRVFEPVRGCQSDVRRVDPQRAQQDRRQAGNRPRAHERHAGSARVGRRLCTRKRVGRCGKRGDDARHVRADVFERQSLDDEIP